MVSEAQKRQGCNHKHCAEDSVGIKKLPEDEPWPSLIETIKTQSLPEEPSHGLFFLAGAEDVGGAD